MPSNHGILISLGFFDASSRCFMADNYSIDNIVFDVTAKVVPFRIRPSGRHLKPMLHKGCVFID